jgi:hypothetical protein
MFLFCHPTKKEHARVLFLIWSKPLLFPYPGLAFFVLLLQEISGGQKKKGRREEREREGGRGGRREDAEWKDRRHKGQTRGKEKGGREGLTKGRTLDVVLVPLVLESQIQFRNKNI